MVKSDLEAMGMSYTQMRLDNWDEYATPSWLDHYDKVLLPWQTDYNVYYGDYYEKLASTRASDGLSVVDTGAVHGTGRNDPDSPRAIRMLTSQATYHLAWT